MLQGWPQVFDCVCLFLKIVYNNATHDSKTGSNKSVPVKPLCQSNYRLKRIYNSLKLKVNFAHEDENYKKSLINSQYFKTAY